MGRLLWTCCPKGHPLHPSNCEWQYATLYPYKRCKRCRSEINRAQYQRRKQQLEWLNMNYQIPARRTAVDTDKTKAAVVVSAVEANASRKANALH